MPELLHDRGIPMHSTTKPNGDNAVTFQSHASNTEERKYARLSYEGMTAPKSLVLLDSRALDRECFAHSLRTHGIAMEVLAFGSIDEWRMEQDIHPPLGVIVLNIGGHKITEAAAEMTALTAEFTDVPVVVLAEMDDLSQILVALEYGIRGYIPASVGIDVCVEAINLAMAGGTFVPASSVMAMRRFIGSGSEVARPMAGMFTQRQEEVVRALRQGKANKIIAYELNLRESTVKVHIRNIMKKLKATNRTEVAYKINKMFPPEQTLYG